MKRIYAPLVPALVIGAVAAGLGYQTPDAVLMAIAAWTTFVVFQKLVMLTSTIVAVCVLGALSQFSFQAGSPPAYAASPTEALPGTFTHFARAVYHGVEDTVGIPHEPPALQMASATPLAPEALAASSSPAAPQPAVAISPALAPVPAPASAVPVIASRAPVPVSTRSAAPLSPSLTAIGQPRVIDGATLSINGQLIRLAGITVPDAATNCARNGKPAACSAIAAERLSQLVGFSRVTCHGPAQGNAILAQCSTQMIDDLGRAMLDEGWAVLSRDAGPAYQSTGAAARGNRRGLWEANFTRAEELEPQPMPQPARARR